MKILYYNWIQFDNKDNIGGGVNIYQRNIIENLIKDSNNEVYFISSGWKYNSFKPKTYLKQTKNLFGDKCKSFEIINSPVMAPAFYTHKNLKKYLNDNITYDILNKFIMKYGVFDVIHFNNIEGISINVLKLKKLYPNTKFVFSVHNYQPICPLVQFFDDKNVCICKNYENGKRCCECSLRILNKKELYHRSREYLKEFLQNTKLKQLFFFLNVLNKLLSLIIYRKYYGATKNKKPKIFEMYRKSNIQLINENVDVILAVSNRVREIMIDKGIEKNKIFTSYIGTKFADCEKKCSIAPKDAIFTLAYLGYKKVDKGYYFLVDALSKLPIDYKRRINIVLAVANLNPDTINNQLENFNNIQVYNGYTHKDLPKILENVHLGIIPVLWEDNLPQVAIEMVSCGIPILCSSFGGASELCNNDLFKFNGGATDELINRIESFVNDKSLLDLYWEYHPPLTTMNKHINDLMYYYKGDFNNA